MPFTEKLLDTVLGILPNATLALIPEHWKKQALERLHDLNPFAAIPDNQDLVRALRVAWIEAAEHVLDAGRKAARPPEWTEVQRADIDRFHGLAITQLRAIRDATFDRRATPGTSAIDGHLPLVVRGAAEVVSAAMGEDDGGARAVTAGFVGTLGALVTGGNPAEVPPIFIRIAAEGVVQSSSGGRRSFGDLVFASFAETLKDPTKYPQANTAFHVATQSLNRTLIEQTVEALRSVDGGLPAILCQIDALNRLSGDAAMAVYRIEECAEQTQTRVDEILTIMHSRGSMQPAEQDVSEAAVRVIVKGLGGEGRNRATITNVPIREPANFLGRDDALAALQVAFGRKAGRVAITALHGLRGVGKTTLAAAYAERHRTDHRAIWWIRAGTEPDLRTDLVALGLRLAWVGAELEEERAVAAVLDRLRDEGEDLLLIYDNALNARQLSPYLPRGGAARILVTSNAPDWRRVAEPVEIAVWPAAVGADYLIARTGRAAERAAAEALSNALGGLPLAHEQAAAYCERLEISLSEYGRRFAVRTVAMLEDPRYAPADYYDGRTVAATFSLAIEAAAELHSAAEPLLLHLALLAPGPIPLFLLREGRSNLGAPLDTLIDDDGFDEAIAALRTFALVGRETIIDERTPTVATETVHVHRLVREVAAARLAADNQEFMRGGLVLALLEAYPVDVNKDPETWPHARRLDGLVVALLDNGYRLPKGTELAAAELLNRVAFYRESALGAYAQSRLLSERALAIKERVLGFNHPSIANNLCMLASLYRKQGRPEASVPLYHRALAIRERALGPDHPDTASSLNDLASLYQHQSRVKEAVPLHHRALTIRERALGPDHPDTASSLNNLAFLYQRQGRLDEAAPLYHRALAIRERVLGPNNPDTASSLNNLAMLYQDQGQLEAAAPLFTRALAIWEKVLDPDHPNTASSLNNLASLFLAQGRLEAAAPLYHRALAIRERALGPDHPDTASSLNNLAMLYQAQGQLEVAAPLLTRALTIWEKALGSDHPNTASSLNNLAFLNQRQGRLDEAATLYHRALAIRERVLGPDHPDAATSINNLASLYQDQGQLEAATTLYHRALAIRERASGSDHPDTATNLDNLASLYRDQGQLDEAVPLYQRALAIRERVFGPDHPSTASSLNNLAFLCHRQGRLDEAAPLYRRALAIREATIGHDHPDTAISLHNLGTLHEEQGRLDEAAPLLARAQAIWEKAVTPLADEH
ncbi:hypothetical protein [Azospirillum argentinense]|uniref:tetratricopeptide repeat protein n=1 Tax=Azospirillum argentinense TaxID=2970906 RepID=UPI0032DEDFE7